jgi:hypothetical protein
MNRPGESPIAAVSLAPRACMLLLLLFSPGFWLSPARGNVLPESAILVHVQPAGLPGEACQSDITQCQQIVRTTTASGPQEFQIFVYPLAYVGEHYPIGHLDLALTWPESWSLLSWSTCGAGSGLLHRVADHYELPISWTGCPVIQGQMFLAASLTLDVVGPGRLDFFQPYGIPLWLGCPPDGFTAIACGFPAEAGMECGYTRFDCARSEHCTPQFTETELSLTAPEGGSALGSLLFHADSATGPDHPCPLVATSRADWASPQIVPLAWPGYRLEVTGDASALAAGVYETEVEVECWQEVARCVHVAFTVTSTVAAPEPGPIGAQRVSWGAVKARYR